MKLLSKEEIGFIILTTVIILLFSYSILGFSGMMTSLGIILLFYFPTYLILNNFELDNDEKLIFSFFIAVGIFPSITYWLGMIISFRIAIFITFIILILTSFLIGKFWKK